MGLLATHVAFATYIFSGFSGDLASHGVGLVLFGSFAACLVTALSSGYRGVIAGLSPALVIGMAVIASTMAVGDDAKFVSVAVALMICATLTGTCCLLIGRFRLANLVRLVPYPVSAGFVAGIGGAVCLAAMSQMGAALSWHSLPAVLEPGTLWRWVPGVAYGTVLYWAMKRWRNPLILPVSVVLAVGGYHLSLAALGLSGTEARDLGLLLTGTGSGHLWPALGPADLVAVEWTAIAMQVPNMLALIVIAMLAVVMNIAGLEVATNQELDWNREFAAGGAASVAAGLGGGTVATIVVPASLRSKLFGAASRLTGVIAALVMACALFVGDAMLELVPIPLVGGMLVFAGLGMLDEGVVRAYRRLPRWDFAIIALIFCAIIGFGLLEGVGAGLLATLVFFAVRLSRVDPIESRYTVREQRSNKARPVPDRAILLEEGERAPCYRLRGYIFFGSVSPLAERLKETVQGADPPECLMLDFAAVSGVDYSAMHVLSRWLAAAHSAGVRLVVSTLPEHLVREFERNLPEGVFAELSIEPNEDRALERCEEIVIAAWKEHDDPAEERRARLLERAAHRLERHLERQIQFEYLMEELAPWLDAREHATGDILGEVSTPHEGLQLLLSGRASAYDGAGSRLYQCEPGDAVWPWGPMEEKVVSVMAEEPSRTLVMTATSQRWLETHRQELVMRLYRLLLASRLQAEPRAGAD